MTIKFDFPLKFIKTKVNFEVKFDLDALKQFIALTSVEIPKLIISKCNIFGSKKIVKKSYWFENMFSILAAY